MAGAPLAPRPSLTSGRQPEHLCRRARGGGGEGERKSGTHKLQSRWRSPALVCAWSAPAPLALSAGAVPKVIPAPSSPGPKEKPRSSLEGSAGLGRPGSPEGECSGPRLRSHRRLLRSPARRGDEGGKPFPGLPRGQRGHQRGRGRAAAQEKRPQARARPRRSPLAAGQAQPAQPGPAAPRGRPRPARHRQRAGAPAHPVPQRRLRRAAQDHPHAALGQAQQDPDAQVGRSLHRLLVPGAAERRAGPQGRHQLQLPGPREAQLRLLRLEDGGRLVHVGVPLSWVSTSMEAAPAPKTPQKPPRRSEGTTPKPPDSPGDPKNCRNVPEGAAAGAGLSWKSSGL